MKNTIINHKKYSVESVFNMVLNYHFTDKNGVIHLVDGEDVTEWINSGDATPEGIRAEDGVRTAIAYARDLASQTEDGMFWWTIKD